MMAALEILAGTAIAVAAGCVVATLLAVLF